jgi:hypothetical protein
MVVALRATTGGVVVVIAYFVKFGVVRRSVGTNCFW